MKKLIHLVYVPFTGLGIREYGGDAWFEYRIDIFIKYVLPSLLNQTTKDFVLWISFRPEEQENPLTKQLKHALDKTEIKYILTFDGVMMHDDRGLKHNEDLKERMEKSLAEVKKATEPVIVSFSGDKAELYKPPEWVYKTDLGSDDLFSKEALAEIQKVEPKERGATYYLNGYVMNMVSGQIAEWNRDTSCSKYTVIFPYETFFNAEKHIEYTSELKSHEFLPKVFDAVRLPDKRYMAGVHKGNISTEWENKFRGEEIKGADKVDVMKRFGLCGNYFEMDGHKFVTYLPQDEKREIDMGDFMRIPYTTGIWEPNTTKLVKEILKEGETVVDVGTSVGYFTLLFARQVGEKGKVISVEQGKMQYQYMIHNVKANGYQDRVLAFNNAAWNKDEKMILPILGYKDKNQVCEGRKVDTILKENGVDKVDLIKIDVDGVEPQILEGLIKTFEANPNLKMIIEYYPEYIEGAGSSIETFWKILNKYFKYKKIEGDYGNNYYNIYCQRK
ncbi:MAG TPA: FkbM family methyltransferase [Candidatus Scalindua sp.]|nr:FkbM family methyltransferase [Candidatus Scalindua sp.]